LSRLLVGQATVEAEDPLFEEDLGGGGGREVGLVPYTRRLAWCSVTWRIISRSCWAHFASSFRVASASSVFLFFSVRLSASELRGATLQILRSKAWWFFCGGCRQKKWPHDRRDYGNRCCRPGPAFWDTAGSGRVLPFFLREAPPELLHGDADTRN